MQPPPRLARGDDLPELARAAASSPYLVLDTEFHAEHRYRPQLLLVQVHAPGGGTWLIDPLDASHLAEAAPALLSRPWLVHAGTHDLALMHARLGAVPEVVWDTQIAAGLLAEDYPAGLAKLAARHLGVEIAKEATLTDWSKRPLSAEQLAYAAADVVFLPALWEALLGEARALGREAIVIAACADARAQALEPPIPDEAWRAIPGARQLAPADAMVLQELALWREELARDRDQPPRTVISDGVLLQFAKRKPTSPAAMQSRRLPKALIKEHGAAIVERVQRAARRPDWAWPRYLRAGTPEERRARFLALYLDHLGAGGRWSARAALPESLVEALCLTAPADRASLAANLGPWRDALLGDALWRALTGAVGLTIAGPTA
jgi:ribonuclease D